MIFNDEFSDTSLDTNKWTTCYPMPTPTGCNHGPTELEWYQPQNVSVGDGLLHLTAKQEQVTDNAGRKYDYTSGMVTTTGKFNFTYGYAEMRAKLTKGKGMWPAFWMLPADDTWPPEIDVMEHLGHEPNRVHMGHHWQTPTGKQNAGTSYVGPDYSADYHTFGVDWSPEALIFYVDGVETYRYTTAANISSKPFYLLANLAVGGEWPGSPDNATVFPQSVLVDYIRVWQRPTQVNLQSLNAQGTFLPDSTVIFTANLKTTGTPMTADTLVVGVRDQSGRNMDASGHYGVTLTGTQTFTFSRAYPTGTYTYWVAYLSGGVWKQLTPEKTFTIAPPPTGLTATYYNNEDFTGNSVTRTEGAPNFNWGTGSPHGSIGGDTFSARWTGKITAPTSGTYTFYTRSDDGVRLWVNGQRLVNNWTVHSPTENYGGITLTGGRTYDIRMEFFERYEGATATLQWKVPGGTRTDIPQSRLSPR